MFPLRCTRPHINNHHDDLFAGRHIGKPYPIHAARLETMSKKIVVVIDFGADFVRAGFAGEASPRCIYASPLRSVRESRHKKAGERLESTMRAHVRAEVCEWLAVLFFEGLLAPKLSQLRILLLENPAAPRWMRVMITDAVLTVGPPEALAFAPSIVAAAGAMSQPTALIVDVGYVESRALAIFEGYALHHTLRVADIDMSRLKGDDDANTDDMGDIASLVFRCLCCCPLETRRRLGSSLLPIGGGAMVSGFDEKLSSHLSLLAPGYRFGILPTAFLRTHLSWIGGSVLAAIAHTEGRFNGVSMDDVKRDGPPDMFAVPKAGSSHQHPDMIHGISFGHASRSRRSLTS